MSDTQSDKLVNRYFGFRLLVTPWAIKAIYVIGIVAILINGWNVYQVSQKSWFVGTSFALECQLKGIAIMVLGNLIWRLACETWIVLFSICDSLLVIRSQNRREPAGEEINTAE